MECQCREYDDASCVDFHRIPWIVPKISRHIADMVVDVLFFGCDSLMAIYGLAGYPRPGRGGVRNRMIYRVSVERNDSERAVVYRHIIECAP